MILGHVIDRLVASEKHAKYEGAKILWVRPIDVGGEAQGEPFLALDTVGAGSGEKVLVTREGGASIIAFGRARAPIDAAIVGIVDRIDVDTEAGS